MLLKVLFLTLCVVIDHMESWGRSNLKLELIEYSQQLYDGRDDDDDDDNGNDGARSLESTLSH